MNSEFLDGLMEKAGVLTKKASKDVNYFYNTKKTEVEIARVKHEIGKIYKAIGELVYNARNEETDSSNIDILCKQIDVKNAYIKELEKRIELFKEEKNLEDEDLKVFDKKPSFMDDDNDDTIIILKDDKKINL